MKNILLTTFCIFVFTVHIQAENKQILEQNSNALTDDDKKTLSTPLLKEAQNYYKIETYDIIHYNTPISWGVKMTKELVIETNASMKKTVFMHKDWFLSSVASMAGEIVKSYAMNPMYAESVESIDFSLKKPKEVHIKLNFEYKEDGIHIGTIDSNTNLERFISYKDLLFFKIR